MTQTKSYTATAKWLHWGMALIWIAAWLVGIVAVHWRDEFNPQHQLTFLHKAMASTLLLLIVLRIAWRLTHSAPAMPDKMKPLLNSAAFI